jgi:hypothetical protein
VPASIPAARLVRSLSPFETDKSMRNRYANRPADDEQIHPGARSAVPVTRSFAPSDLDIDDLAEAIGLLLVPDQEPLNTSQNQPDCNLLSFPKRGSHVVKRTRTA